MSDYINSLPKELLALIFDFVPLTDLLHLDCVCPYWSTLLPAACARRHSLVLLFGTTRLNVIRFVIPFNDLFNLSFDGEHPFYDLPAPERMDSIRLPYLMSPYGLTFDDFLDGNFEESGGFFGLLYRAPLDGADNEDYFSELARLRSAHSTDQHVAYFTNLFPNVHNLVVIDTDCHEHNTLISLVGSWSLVTLKLWINFRGIDNDEDGYLRLHHPERHPVHALLQSIMTQQPTLQQLCLDIRGDGGRALIPVQLAPFIAQLKMLKVRFGYYDEHGAIWDIVHRGHSDQLRHIGMADYVDTELEATMLNPRFDFTTKVHQLYWPFMIENVRQLRNLCTRYGSLTLLRMQWEVATVTFADLVAHLATLKQLTHLELLNIYPDFASPENTFALVDRAAVDGGGDEDGEAAAARPISLPQVKILGLEINKSSHLDFESLSPLVFPSVEALMLRDGVYKCTICHLNGRVSLGSGNCHRELILSVKNRFTAPLLRIFSAQDGPSYGPEWNEWSQFLHLPDEEWPQIADLDDEHEREDEEEED